MKINKFNYKNRLENFKNKLKLYKKIYKRNNQIINYYRKNFKKKTPNKIIFNPKVPSIIIKLKRLYNLQIRTFRFKVN